MKKDTGDGFVSFSNNKNAEGYRGRYFVPFSDNIMLREK